MQIAVRELDACIWTSLMRQHRALILPSLQARHTPITQNLLAH